jgi:hypothetical protein
MVTGERETHSIIHYNIVFCNAYTHALAAFARALRTTSLLVFFANMTSNRAKSFNDHRFWMAARFFAHAEFSHLAMVPSFLSCLRMAPEPAPRGSLVRRRGVRERWR